MLERYREESIEQVRAIIQQQKTLEGKPLNERNVALLPSSAPKNRSEASSDSTETESIPSLHGEQEVEPGQNLKQNPKQNTKQNPGPEQAKGSPRAQVQRIEKERGTTTVAPIHTEKARVDSKFYTVRNRVCNLQSHVPRARNRVLEQFGENTGEFLERYSINLSRDLSTIVTPFLGWAKSEECVYGRLPYMETFSRWMHYATLFPKTMISRCTRYTPEKGIEEMQAQAARGLSDILVTVTDRVGNKIAQTLDHPEQDSVKRSNVKIVLLHDLSDRVKDFFDRYSEARRHVQMESPVDPGLETVQKYSEKESEVKQRFIDRLHANPTDILNKYDTAIAKRLVEKLLPDILEVLPDGISHVPGIAKILGKDNLKGWITLILAQILSATRGSLISETALKNHLANALSAANNSIESLMRPSDQDTKVESKEALQKQAKKVRKDDEHSKKDNGIASATRSILTFLLGIKPSGFWNRTVLDNVFLKRFINKKIDKLLTEVLDNQGQPVSFAKILDEVFKGLNDGMFLVDGEYNWTPNLTLDENPRVFKEEDWKALTEDKRRETRKQINTMPADKKERYQENEKKFATRGMANEIKKIAGLLAKLSINPESCFTGSLFIHYQKVTKENFINQSEIEQEAENRAKKIEKLASQSPLLDRVVKGIDVKGWAKSSISGLKKAEKYATIFFYHVWYTLRINLLVSAVVAAIDSFTRNPMKKSVENSIQKTLQTELEGLASSNLRHVLYNDILEELLVKLDLLTKDEVDEIHQETIVE